MKGRRTEKKRHGGWRTYMCVYVCVRVPVDENERTNGSVLGKVIGSVFNRPFSERVFQVPLCKVSFQSSFT